jgi:carbamoyl-phosphate synthase large subunit
MLGAGKRASMAEQFKVAALNLGYQCQLFSYESEREVPIAQFAEVIVGKKFADVDSLADIRQTISEKKIDIVIPFHDSAVAIASQLGDKVFVPVSSSKAVEIFSDKKETGRYLRTNSIPTPKLALSAPAIAKPIHGSSSQGLVRLLSDEQLSKFRASNEANQYEIQELCSGPELSVDGYVALNGSFRKFAPRLRLETLNGEATKSRTVRDDDVELICNDLCTKANLKGAITVQFIWNEVNKSYLVMEVNLRFGGGVLTTILAGIPWPEILLRDYLGMEQQQYDYDHDFLMVRSFREFGFSMKNTDKR